MTGGDGQNARTGSTHCHPIDQSCDVLTAVTLTTLSQLNEVQHWRFVTVGRNNLSWLERSDGGAPWVGLT